MALLSREKGKEFERAIAARLRELWPGTVIRRASQAERAFNPDVLIEHGPLLLRSLWLELHDAANPRPLKKLHQAERDESLARRETTRIPIVVWHRIREQGIQVTTRVHSLIGLFGTTSPVSSDMPVTVDLSDFLRLLKVLTEGEPYGG